MKVVKMEAGETSGGREYTGKERQDQLQHPQHLIGRHYVASQEVIFSARAGRSRLR